MEFRRQASSLKEENVTRIHFRERNFTTLATVSSRNNFFSDFSKHLIPVNYKTFASNTGMYYSKCNPLGIKKMQTFS